MKIPGKLEEFLTISTAIAMRIRNMWEALKLNEFTIEQSHRIIKMYCLTSLVNENQGYKKLMLCELKTIVQ